MRIVRLILSAALAASAFAGIQILSTDYWLWSAAPTHAYGLVAFVSIDLALMLGVWRFTRVAVFVAVLTSATQLVAMVGDIIAGEPAGLTTTIFRNYLLTDSAYVGLLVTQGFIMAIAIGSWALPHLHGHWLTSLRTLKR